VKLPRLLAVLFIIFGTSFFLPAHAEQTGQITVVCANDAGVSKEFRVGWDNTTGFFEGKGNIAALFCQIASGGYKTFISTTAPESTWYYNGIAPTVNPSPEPSAAPATSPSPEPTPSPVVQPSETPTATSSPSPSTEPVTPPSPSPSPESTQSSSPTPSPLPSPSDTPTSIVETSTTLVDTVTVVVEPVNPQPQPVPDPVPVPSPPPVVVPEPVEIQTPPVPEPPQPESTPPPAADPQPIPEPQPEPAPEVQPEPEPAPPEPAVEPEPAPVEPEPQPQPEPQPDPVPAPPEEVPGPSIPEPAPSEPPAVAPEPPVVATEDSTPEERAVVADALIEAAHGEPVTAQAIQDAGLTYEDLPPDTPVEVRQDENGNEVVITAEVAAALVVLENPAALVAALFTDPAQALLAIASIGADMSVQERAESEKIIIASVIAGQAAVNAAGMAGAAAYRRKP